MFISKIVIRNYRNFRHLSLPLTPGVTCVVGENNTGKTNFVRAIRLPIDAALSSHHRALEASDFHSASDPALATQVLVSLEIQDFAGKDNEEAMVAGWAINDDVARITYRFRPRPAVIEDVESGEREDGTLSVDDYRWEIRGAGGEVDPETVRWDRDFGRAIRFEELQQFLVVLLPPLRDVEQSLRQGRYSPLTRLLTGAEIPEEEQQSLIDVLSAANTSIADTDTIGRIGEMIDESFASASGEAFRMQVQLGMSSPTFSDISRRLTVLLSNRAMSNFDPSMNGLGLNNILYTSMLLRYFEERIAAGNTPGQLLLFEEPEAHLHPQLQRVLFGSLLERPFQTIATTHSTHITAQVPLRSIIVLTDDGTPAAASCVPSQIPELSSEYQADLERYLDATRGALLFARKVMLVEGPAEQFLIPPLVKKVMGIDLETHGISVIPIYGVHFPAYAKLFGPDGIAKKCAIVADGDLSPSDAIPPSEDDPEELTEVEYGFEDLDNAFVKTFRCRTTFERAITTRHNIPIFIASAREVGATRVADRMAEAQMRIHEDGVHTTVRDLVLSTAKRFGKARFAQITSKRADQAKSLPRYIRDAVEWLLDDAAE